MKGFFVLFPDIAKMYGEFRALPIAAQAVIFLGIIGILTISILAHAEKNHH